MGRGLSKLALCVVLLLTAAYSANDLSGYTVVITEFLNDLGRPGKLLIWLLSQPSGTLLLIVVATIAAYGVGKSLRDSLPMIRALGVRVSDPIAIKRTFISYNETKTQIIGEPRFVEMSIANEATGDEAGTATAKSVAGLLWFYRDDGVLARGPLRYARWVGKPEPQNRYELAASSELELPPNGIPHAVNIALKYDDEAEAFGFTNENTVRGVTQGWRFPEHSLPEARYWVRVEFRGVGVPFNRFWIRLINPGAGASILATLDQPSFWFRLTHRK